MTAPIAFDAGGYSYLKGGFQYSAAVIAQPGFEVERARLTTPAPWSIGKGLIEAHLARLGRPTTALCAVELRSPLPLSEADFVAFNREYVIPLERWGLYRDGANPVARCNLCPAVGAPKEARLYAFSYTVNSDTAAPTFVTSGAAECPDRPNYRDNIVRLGETGPEALREKLRFALGEIEERLATMRLDWTNVLSTRLYTVHDLHHTMADEFGRRGLLSSGIEWHLVRPPVRDIEIEIDARAVRREIVIDS